MCIRDRDKKNALIAVDSYDNTPRQQIGYNETLRKTFRDERVAFTEEQVKKETARCLGCGASIVDPNKCIGCGVCTTKCVFDAISLKRDHPECTDMRRAEDKLGGIVSMAGVRLGQTITGGVKKIGNQD